MPAPPWITCFNPRSNPPPRPARLPATVAPTATPRGGRAAPTATPAARVLTAAYIRRLPLVLKGWPPTLTPTATATPTRTATPTATPTPTPIKYGWKGAGYPGNLYIAATPIVDKIWGVNIDWWYDWGLSTTDNTARGAASSDAILAALANGLQDPGYVPMIYCTSEAGGPDPAGLTELARRFPGRVWLIFNEPDNADGCGGAIESWMLQHRDLFPDDLYDGHHWTELGRYFGEQYAKYYDALKSGDPSARLYPLGLLELPMPSLTPGVGWGNKAIRIWNGFTDYLAATTMPAPLRTPRPFDGIAVHAYPYNYSTFHTGCQGSFVDASCVQRALVDAHRFFQGTPGPASTAVPNGNTHPELTAGKAIWITETGSLTSKFPRPGSPPQSQTTTRDSFEAPMVAWFQSHIGVGQDCQYINAVAWFSAHACWYLSAPPPAPNPTPGPSPTPLIEDYTASDLLDIGALTCPLQQAPSAHNLTVVGQYWRDAVCVKCQCPGLGLDCQ